MDAFFVIFGGGFLEVSRRFFTGDGFGRTSKIAEGLAIVPAPNGRHLIDVSPGQKPFNNGSYQNLLDDQPN